MTLEFSVQRRLGEFTYDVDIAAHDEILVLYGHSGAGKSLTLQFTAGLIRPDRGRIVIGAATVFDSATRVNLAPQQRGVGYVVQELALFEHLSVADNVAFGLPRGRDRDLRVSQLLELLALTGFEDRRPRTLSGGQRQRVALARAIGREATLLLLDEPFSALDESLRTSMRGELLRLRAELGMTILFVTHDLREAHLLADRIAVFDEGRVLQLDSRDTVFRKPASRRVAELTGVANVLRGSVVRHDAVATHVAVGPVTVVCAPSVARDGDSVDIAIRAERVVLRRNEAAAEHAVNVFPAAIVDESAYGPAHVLRLRLDGTDLHVNAELAARPYEVLGVATRRNWLVQLPIEDLHVMPA